MTSEYFFTAPDPVASALRGFARAHGDTVRVSLDPAFVVAADPSPTRAVALVSGGGSGHEPLHTGFVGRGGLDAAVPGQVFTSPHNHQVFAAASAVARPGGVLFVVKNYTGDVINFAIAAERLRAQGVPVETVLVDDDLATTDAAATGRRGTGATVLVEKVLGAAADEGADLAGLAALGRAVVEASRSVAVATRAHTAPGTSGPAFALADDELEYGVGIHGERAVSTVERGAAADVVERMVTELLAAVPATPTGVAVLVNGLGSVTGLELYSVLDRVAELLERASVPVAATFTGTYVAALDMRGISITLTALQPEWLAHLTSATATPALPAGESVGAVLPSTPATDDRADGRAEGEVPDDALLRLFTDAVTRLHPVLTRLDQVSGDGDFGDNLAGGLTAARTSRVPQDTRNPGLLALERSFLDDVGGSSGPLYGLLFQQLRLALDDGADADAVRAGLGAAADAVTRVGGAVPGDRTMVDPLSAAAAAPGSLDDVARAAVAGARATADMTPRRGRASYVGDRALGTPDPGAVGVALVVVALAAALDPALDAADLLGAWD